MKLSLLIISFALIIVGVFLVDSDSTLFEYIFSVFCVLLGIVLGIMSYRKGN